MEFFLARFEKRFCVEKVWEEGGGVREGREKGIEERRWGGGGWRSWCWDVGRGGGRWMMER